MRTYFILWLPYDKMIRALCWTLLHSLWQGLLLTIVAVIIITATRKSKPALRYNLLTALFLSFIVFTGLTFVYEISIAENVQAATAHIAAGTQTIYNTDILRGDTFVSTPSETNYLDSIMQYVNAHASFIVVAWLIVFSIKLARIFANIRYVQYLRLNKTVEPSFYWKQKINELAQSLRIQHCIFLLESTIVKAPVVIGILKPLILVPIGLLSNLPAEQVEAVLLHELAHIRRKDYLVNLLQSITEVIFFFNPALVWISSLIREEREACCDDITINQTKNKKQFIYALVAFQEYIMRPSNTNTVVAFDGQKKYLLNRVKRIIYNENKKLNAMEKGIFIFSIVALSLIGFTTVKQSTKQKVKSSLSVQSVTNVLDTVPVSKDGQPADTIPGLPEIKSINSVINKDNNTETKTITATDNKGKKYKIILDNDTPMELYVNDKKIPPEEMGNYQEIITSIEKMASFRQEINQQKMKIMSREDQEKKLKQLDAQRSELLAKLGALDDERAKLGNDQRRTFGDGELDEVGKLNLLKDQLFMMPNNNTNDFLLNMPGFNFKTDSGFLQNQLFNGKATTLNDNFLSQLLQNDNEANQKHGLLLNDKLNNLQNDGDQKFGLSNQNWFQQNNTLEEHIQPVIEDLLEEKIISTADGLSFDLNSHYFTVNGEKQSSEVYERFRKKYLKKEGDYLKYSKKNGRTNISINLN